MLTLGVPGSGTTAVMLAMLISLNVQPGPLLFTKQPELFWGLVASLYAANVALRTPIWILMPMVVAISFLGIYAISQSAFALLVMIGFGVLGYVFRKLDISLVPIVLGLLLGTDMVNDLRRALSISGGNFGILVASPIAVGLYVGKGLLLCLAAWLSVRKPLSPR